MVFTTPWLVRLSTCHLVCTFLYLLSSVSLDLGVQRAGNNAAATDLTQAQAALLFVPGNILSCCISRPYSVQLGNVQIADGNDRLVPCGDISNSLYLVLHGTKF
jgi:hypothetical protein